MKQGFHEDFDRTEKVEGSSERTFGLVFAGLFAAVGLWPLLGGGGPRLWSLGIAALFLALATLRPAALRPLNRLWLRFGLLLHKVVNPLVLGLLFYATVTPTGLLMRLAGKDPLGRRFDPAASSYWVLRDPPGPAPETMKKQF